MVNKARSCGVQMFEILRLYKYHFLNKEKRILNVRKHNTHVIDTYTLSHRFPRRRRNATDRCIITNREGGVGPGVDPELTFGGEIKLLRIKKHIL